MIRGSRARLAGAALVAALCAGASNANDSDAAAVAKWRPLAQAGDREAQWQLGRAYMAGQGVQADQALGVRWMMKCAQQGNTAAAVVVAVAFENGKGVERSDTEAAKWYLAAAKAGDGDSQRTMAVWYATGHGVAQDPVSALAWFYTAYGLDSPDEAVFVKVYMPDVGTKDLARARALARERVGHR